MYQPSQVAAKRFGFCNPTSPTQGQWASQKAYKSHSLLGFSCNPTSPLASKQRLIKATACLVSVVIPHRPRKGSEQVQRLIKATTCLVSVIIPHCKQRLIKATACLVSVVIPHRPRKGSEQAKAYKSHSLLGFCNPTSPTQGQSASEQAYKSHIPKLINVCLARPFWLRSSVDICWDFSAFFKYFWVLISWYYRKYRDIIDIFDNIAIFGRKPFG